MSKKDNKGLPSLFSGEFREVTRRLKRKKPELDEVLNRGQQEQPKRKNAKAKAKAKHPPFTPYTGRSGPLIRQWHIIRHLSENPSGCQVQELCRVLKTRPRTIYRDLEALKRAGFPLMRRQEDRMGIWTIEAWWRDDFQEKS